MSGFRTVAPLAGLLVLVGCSAPSINPIYSEDKSDVVEDASIVGTWTGDDGDVTLEVTKEDGQKWYAVRVTWRDREKAPVGLEAHIVELGGKKWVDLYPADDDRDEIVGRYGLAYLPAHVVARYEVEEGTLRYIQTDNDWLTSHLKDNPEATPHVMWDDVVVLTGTTAQVREFLAGVTDVDAAFVDPVNYKRVKSSDDGG